MTTFNIRLVERTTHQGAADFMVEAASATEAAIIVAEAHTRAQGAGIGLVVLPDGQEGLVEGESVVARERNFYLIDDAGLEVEEIPMVEPPSRPHER